MSRLLEYSAMFVFVFVVQLFEEDDGYIVNWINKVAIAIDEFVDLLSRFDSDL